MANGSYARNKIHGIADLPYAQGLVGGIYDWAGKYRIVDVSKDDFTWPPAALVAANMARLETDMLSIHTPCVASTTAEAARKIAEVHAELLLVHPFRDGNGRVARWLADLMALQAGLPVPDYGFTGPGSKLRRLRYLNGVKLGYLRRYEDLAAFFEGAFFRGGAGG